ncbi:nucleotidyltransferase family protein [Candidatus Parabeggiatoa sp. HSG14]|uniref:nucleotidyltransferase family protein n=1 Tax=Candidatus Parabeggiatoa sp. HSG14 TaxID=3055593 RepID=UPI0025A854A8|nr:nucleotidyltransferase family protein [Thiotrichales bacterium HSG14]
MNVTLSFLKQKRCKIIELAKRHGANNIRIFGSVARGEANAESDIDFLVNMNANKGLLEKIALIQDLETFLNKKIDVVTEKSLHWYIRERVIKEAVSL